MKTIALVIVLALSGCLYGGDDTPTETDAGLEADAAVDARAPSILGRWAVLTNVSPCGVLDQPRLDFRVMESAATVNGWTLTESTVDLETGRVVLDLVGADGAERWDFVLEDDGVETHAELTFTRGDCTAIDGNVAVIVRERL